MAKVLNFNKIKKSYLTVTFADEKERTIMVCTPNKAIMDDLTLLQANIDEIGEDGTNETATGELYEACAKIMSRNKAGVKITKDYLERVFDFEDIMIFFRAYRDFISEVVNQKN